MTLFESLHKTLPATLLFAVALGNSPALLAQECQINLSNRHLDYGQVQHPAGNIGQASRHRLDRREIRLTASCQDESTIQLTLRGALVANQMKFSERGQVSVQLSQAQLDGRPVSLAKLNELGALGSPQGALGVAPGDAIVPVDAGHTARGKTLTLTLEVTPEIPLSDLRSRDAKNHEGQLQIDVSGT